MLVGVWWDSKKAQPFLTGLLLSLVIISPAFNWRGGCYLEFRNDWRSAPIEVIVHASTNCVPTCVVVHAVEADAEVVAPAAVAAGNVGVEVFNLRRPVRHEHPLCAAASCPAGLRS